jgi:predicted CoA-binding protein
MPSRAVIDRFLAQRHLALVGVSHNEKELANVIYRQLRDGGRTMYGVNRDESLTTVEGDPCYHRLADIPGDVDGVIVMVPASAAADVVRDAIACGIPRVWLHRGVGAGAVSPEAVALCDEHGVEVVDGACPMMFAEPVTFVHRVHRAFSRRRFVA